jgi:hypothetical protein
MKGFWSNKLIVVYLLFGGILLILPGCGEDKIKKGKEDPTVEDPDTTPPDETETVSDTDDAAPTGSDEVSDSDRVVPIMSEFTNQTQNGYCGKVFQCCTAQEREENLGVSVESEEECESEQFGPAFAGALSKYTKAVERGTVTYNEDAAEACSQQMSQQSCSEFAASEGMFSENRAGCSDVFVPQLDEGDSCQDDIECKTGFCKRKVNEDGSFDDTERTCAKPPGEGQPCFNGKCQGDYYCDTSSAPLPEDWICKEKKDAGESCQNGNRCKSGKCEQVDGAMECIEPTKQTLCSGDGTERGQEGS